MRIDLQRLFSMVPREEELAGLLGDLDAREIYEIHITVKSDGEIEQFRECCNELEVKPLVVQLANGAVPDDVMTSSCLECTPSELRDECMRILIGLEVMGWKTVRCKIECSPRHNKVVNLVPNQILPFQYFESHIPITVGKHDEMGTLRVLCRMFDMHLSANAFRIQDDTRTIMATYRSTLYTHEAFRKEVYDRVILFREALFETTTPVVEFAIFDSNRDHDKTWLSSSKFGEVDPEALQRFIADRKALVENSLNLG